MLTKRTGDLGATVLSAVDGLARLVLTPEETRAFVPGLYRDTARATGYLAGWRFRAEHRAFRDNTGADGPLNTKARRPALRELAVQPNRLGQHFGSARRLPSLWSAAPVRSG
jgi:hypothetical protein